MMDKDEFVCILRKRLNYLAGYADGKDDKKLMKLVEDTKALLNKFSPKKPAEEKEVLTEEGVSQW